MGGGGGAVLVAGHQICRGTKSQSPGTQTDEPQASRALALAKQTFVFQSASIVGWIEADAN